MIRKLQQRSTHTAPATALAALMMSALVLGMMPTAHARDHTGTAQSAWSADRKDPTTMARKAAAALVRSRAPELKIGKHDGFVAEEVVASGDLSYASYERTYRGLPVVGGDFVVVTDDEGHVLATSVAQTSMTRLASTTPTVGKGRATSVARQQLDRIRNTEAPRLVVWQGKTSHLAWEVEATGRDHGHPSIQSVYVDARTGKYLASKENVAAGTGNTAYAGRVSIPTTLTGSTYFMRHPDAPSLECLDYYGGQTFSGPDDEWGDGKADDRETVCADALYAADQERRMLSEWLGRDGMDGLGGWVPIRMGLADTNAYYAGTSVDIGQSEDGRRLGGSLDVVGHEFGHGIDSHTPGGISDLTTREFVADAFGAATEWFADNPVDRPDYLIGEQVNWHGLGQDRNMADPGEQGHPDCYDAALLAIAETHAAAGVGNHWFYLLAEGSNPTNGQPISPTCNRSKVTGVGIQTALHVLYNAMLMKTSFDVLPEVPVLDADRREADGPVLQPLRQGEGCLGRRHRAGPPPGRDLHAARCRDGGRPRHQVREGGQPGLLLHPVRLRRHHAVHLVGHRPPTGPHPRPQHRHRLRYADPRGQLRRDGDSDGPRRLERQLVVQIRHRCGRVLGATARQPRLRERLGGPMVGVVRSDRRLPRTCRAVGQLEGLAERLRRQRDRHAQPDGVDPRALPGEVVVLPARRLRGDQHKDGV